MNKQDLHNQGQADAAKGEHHPPHSVAETVGAGLPILGDLFGDFSKICDENKAYSEGWNHARNQKK